MRARGTTLVAVLTATVTGVALGVPAVSAAPTWAPVETLAAATPVSHPDVVLDRRGTATAVWSASGTVVATRRTAGGSWGPAVVLGHGVAPVAGVDRHGAVTVAWTRQRDGFGPQVMAARRPAGHAWRRAVALSSPAPSNGSTAHGAFLRDVAVGWDGAVAVTWLWGAEDSGASRVQARYRATGASGWGPVATLSPVEADDPVVAVDARGGAVVAYTVDATAYAVRRVAGRWATPVRIARHVEPPQVATDDAGDVVVVVSALRVGTGDFVPRAVTRDAGGGWSAPVTLDDPTHARPVVGIGPHGTSTVAWTRADGQVVASRRAVGGPWSAPHAVAPAGDPAGAGDPALQVAVGRDGSTLLTWTRHGVAADRVEASYRPVSGGWQSPVRVSPARFDSADARAAVGRHGTGVLVWRGVVASGDSRILARTLRPGSSG